MFSCCQWSRYGLRPLDHRMFRLERQHLHQILNGRSHEGKEGFGIQTDPEDKNQDRNHDDDLAPVEVANAVSMVLYFIHDLALRTEEHHLEHVEDIYSRHDDTEGGNCRVPGVANCLRTER